MKQLFTIAWRNLRRKIWRAALLAGSAGLTASILFSSYFFVHSMERSVEASSSRLGADLLVVPAGHGGQAGDMIISGTPTPFYMPMEVMDKIREIPEVEQLTPQIYLETVSTICCRVEGDFPIVAFDPETDFTLRHWMARERTLGQYEALIGSEAGGKNFIYHYDNRYIDEWVTLFGQDFLIKGVLFPTGMGTDHTIFMSIDSARALNEREDAGLNFPDSHISIVLVKVKPGMENFVAGKIERMNLGVDVVKGSGLRETIGTQIFPVKLLSYIMIALVLIMSSLQVMTMFSAVISERRKEIGMLRAMGASRFVVYRILLTEAGIAAFIGAALGSLAAGALLYDNRIFIMQVLQLPLLFPRWGSGVLIGLFATVLTVLISMAAAYIPIRGALRLEPYEAIREGE